MYRKSNYALIWKLPFSQRIKEGKEKEMKAEEEKEKERDKKIKWYDKFDSDSQNRRIFKSFRWCSWLSDIDIYLHI